MHFKQDQNDFLTDKVTLFTFKGPGTFNIAAQRLTEIFYPNSLRSSSQGH